MGRLFGTDGIRGVANEKLTVELAVATGRAVAASIGMAKDKSNTKKTILLGMDTRISSDMLASALTAGILSVGYDVINLGVVPTPAVAYLTRRYKARAGIMISASHNPFEFNGIKVFNADGFKLADELEENIESMVLGEVPMPKPATGAKIGKIIHKPEAIDEYIKFVASTTTERLDGLTVAFDCANGSSSRTAEKLFTSLGVNCVMLSDKPDGTNINDNCGSTHIEHLQKYVLDNGLDVGFAFDGDADRCLAVDEKGNVVNGDHILYVCAKYMQERGIFGNSKVVTTIMSNMGLYKALDALGIGYEKTAVGDKYVAENMRQNGHLIGGEQSGHIIFGRLANTGDGILTAIKVMEAMCETKQPLSVLASGMKMYPQKLKNVVVTDKDETLNCEEVKAAVKQVEAELGENGRVVLRKSGTEPLLRVMVEATSDDLCEEKVDYIIDAMRKCGKLIRVK